MEYAEVQGWWNCKEQKANGTIDGILVAPTDRALSSGKTQKFKNQTIELSSQMSQEKNKQSSTSELTSEMVEKTSPVTAVDTSEQSDNGVIIDERTREDNKNGPVVQMSKTRLLFVFIGLAFGIFLAALDMTIVATALLGNRYKRSILSDSRNDRPAIAIEFNALNDLAWIGTSYLLTAGFVEREYVASATSLLTFFRTFGAVFGIAILGTIFNNEFSKNINAVANLLPPGLDPGSISENSSVLATLSESQKLPIIHAFVKSLDVAFEYVIPMSGLCFLSVFGMKILKPTHDKREETLDLHGVVA
ncbi:6433_t:CDS:2 [Acaulospora colombiana]|uniref:6433_t:CDS:1 n=1 Tax=Acaulospora colombiana TaxID=27376 RepID=A0ACA9LYT3_9GLOM|nr:6433_t:CDS:2 [Acaulospora colombiana]